MEKRAVKRMCVCVCDAYLSHPTLATAQAYLSHPTFKGQFKPTCTVVHLTIFKSGMVQAYLSRPTFESGAAQVVPLLTLGQHKLI